MLERRHLITNRSMTFEVALFGLEWPDSRHVEEAIFRPQAGLP